MRRALVCSLLISNVAFAAVPTGFTETSYTSNQLPLTTSFAFAPDGSGRLFILNKGGQVRIARIQNGEPVMQGGSLALTTFATETVYTNSEGGLLSVSFDPNYLANRYVYFFVSASASVQRIVRYTDDNSVGVARTVIVDNLPTAGQNHVGGATGFGPDGLLYWAIGDLGNGTGVDADLGSLASKVGRANLNGTPVNDNPFNDGVGPNNEYVWARGFRNPFTFTFRPEDGALWVNCVGTGYEQIFRVGRGDHAGYNDYENNQPSGNGYITPMIKYRTNGTDTRNLTATGAVRDAAGVITFTTTGVHGFRKGERLVVAGVTDASFNGTYFVTGTPSATTWTAQGTGAAASSGNGTATTTALGGSITGGTFYDSTLFDAPNRGAFFFGDYNSGQITRALLASDGSVAEVEPWGTGFSSSVDVEVGPDGALYFVGVSSNWLKRVKPTTLTDKLVVTPRHLRVVEGGRAQFTVALSKEPVAPVSVSVTTAAANGLVLTTPATLTFDATNWATPQSVIISAPDDANSVNEVARFDVAATGYASEDVTVTTIDNNGARLALSTTQVTVAEASTETFTVALSKQPSAPVTVTVARTSGSSTVTVASGAALTFNAVNWNVPQTVTVSAAADANATDETAILTVAAPGLDARSVEVVVADDEPFAPTITSLPTLTGVQGAPYTHAVVATGRPAPTFSLVAAGAGQSIDATTGLLSWTPMATGTTHFHVRASNGLPPDADQEFDVVVSADQAPTIALTRPTVDERVAGTMGEFYGDCFDDVGCTRAEFYVDGVLISTDTNTSGHYHVLGEHNRWDTSLLADGSHQVRMVVFDTANQSAFIERQVCAGSGPCVPPVVDAGLPDAGEVDAGVEVDAGIEVDAGVIADAGVVDAGVITDAGVVDAGQPSMADAGTMAPDAGVEAPMPPAGCGCGSTSGSATLLLLALGVLRRRKA